MEVIGYVPVEEKRQQESKPRIDGAVGSRALRRLQKKLPALRAQMPARQAQSQRNAQRSTLNTQWRSRDLTCSPHVGARKNSERSDPTLSIEKGVYVKGGIALCAMPPFY
jgi:hypothetical protein